MALCLCMLLGYPSPPAVYAAGGILYSYKFLRIPCLYYVAQSVILYLSYKTITRRNIMKSTHIVRILSVMLSLVLVFSAVPTANAFTFEGKASAPADEKAPLPDFLEAGGDAPILMADEVEYVAETEPNNSAAQANVVELNTILVGETSAEDMSDFYKFTLPETSDISFVSASSAPNMIFGLFPPEGGSALATCVYYGQEEDFYIDAIICTLEAGTYYLLVQQTNVENGPAAYSGPLSYALELHVHDYTIVESAEPTCTAAGYRAFACGCVEELPMLSHTYAAGTPVPPTCTENGYTPYTCSACHATTTDDFVEPLGHDLIEDNLVIDTEAKTHSFTCNRCEKSVAEPCAFEEEPDTGIYYCSVCGADAGTVVFRIYGETRVETSLAIANALKEELETAKFDTVIVASALNFPDALTGSYLAAVKDAPILLTYEAVHADTVAYITQNMSYDGTVYILGGESAVSTDFENRLTELGIAYKRLAGTDRFGTNLAILAEAGVTAGQDVLVCTSAGFADSLSASAAGLPILLVGSTLTEDQKEFLSGTEGKLILIGGTSAVSSEVEAELTAYGETERLAGSSRYETSVLVAERFYPAPSAVVLAYAQNYPDGLCGGPLAYRLGAPLILTDGNSSWASSYMAWRDIEGGYVLGGSILVEDRTVRTLFDMEDNEPIPKKR